MDGYLHEKTFDKEVDIALAVFAFGIALRITVLLSETAQRTALSAAVIFLVAGFLFGSDALPPPGWTARFCIGRLRLADPGLPLLVARWLEKTEATNDQSTEREATSSEPEKS